MNAGRQKVSSGSPYEKPIGFSRAVRVGNMVFVSGTGPVGPDGKTTGVGDAEAQARRCLEIIAAALNEAGAELKHVVRTRMYVTDIALWEEVGRAHGEAFGDIQPAATMVEVSGLIDPDWVIEIEVEALIVEDNESWQNAWAPTD